MVIVQLHRLNVCSTSKYVRSASVSGFVLGFDEDDGNVIDFDNDGEVLIHKKVSRHFLVTNIHFYSSLMSREGKRSHVDWVKAWLCTLTELQAYV